MAYQRVTLAQLKARLAERIGGENTFWSEPEREAALNEAIAVWQLLTGDFVAIDTAVTLTTNENLITFTNTSEPPLTLLRVRCDAAPVADFTWLDTPM